MLQLSVFAGFSRSHIKFYALSRTVTHEVHLPPAVRVQSFSKSAVCFASKENTPKDGSSEGGKVLYNNRFMSTMVCMFISRYFQTSLFLHDRIVQLVSNYIKNAQCSLNVQLRFSFLCRKVQQVQLGRDLWVRVWAGQEKEEVSYAAPDVETSAHRWRHLYVSVITF